jgi:hypothetical protein
MKQIAQKRSNRNGKAKPAKDLPEDYRDIFDKGNLVVWVEDWDKKSQAAIGFQGTRLVIAEDGQVKPVSLLEAVEAMGRIMVPLITATDGVSFDSSPPAFFRYHHAIADALR